MSKNSHKTFEDIKPQITFRCVLRDGTFYKRQQTKWINGKSNGVQTSCYKKHARKTN